MILIAHHLFIYLASSIKTIFKLNFNVLLKLFSSYAAVLQDTWTN